MKTSYFQEKLGMIYATFGKPFPKDDVATAIFRRVESLPDGFMDYALEKLQDMDKLPGNLGAFLKRDLWPDYHATHPTLWAQNNDYAITCPRCRYNYPGVKDFYTPDGEIKLCACDCCTDERMIKLMGKIPDDELLRLGYLLERPEPQNKSGQQWLEKYLKRI